MRLNGAIGMDLARWEALMDLLDAHPKLWAPIKASTLLTQTEGRPRHVGEWGLALLHFVNSGEPALLRWHRAVRPELWTRCGFDRAPSYHKCYEAFNALEAHSAAFDRVAASLIAKAQQASGGHVGRDVHVDGTEAETNARLHHDCRGDELDACQRQDKVLERAHVTEMHEQRHAVGELAPDEDALQAAEDEQPAERGKRVKLGGCWYLLGDDEAGVRSYTRKGGTKAKNWVGFYNLKAVDHYTGGVLAVHAASASVQEYHAYPDLYASLKRNLGGAVPRAVVADKGFSVTPVFELHTRDGVASVMPWRPSPQRPERLDQERYDRDGVPRCKHCESECVFHRFQHDSGPNREPRLWFRCAHPQTAQCTGVQSILCKESWRELLPLWSNTPAYVELRHSHQQYEYAHHRWRERYAVAGNNSANRPKRLGAGVQQLRASAAMVIEWLTICHRQGWLGTRPINHEAPILVSKEQHRRLVSRITGRRQRLGLNVTYGEGLKRHQHEVADTDHARSEGARKGHAARATDRAARDRAAAKGEARKRERARQQD